MVMYDLDRVLINGKQSKPSAEVSEGDIITVGFGEKERKYRVLSVKETVRKDQTGEMYEEL